MRYENYYENYYKNGDANMKCELKYVAYSYKDVLVSVKCILIIIAGACVGIYLDIPAYVANIVAAVSPVMLYIAGYLHCKKNSK